MDATITLVQTRRALMSSDEAIRPPTDASAEGPDAPLRPDLFDALWGFFSSTKVALVLILTVAGLALFSVLVSQAPAGLVAGSTDYQSWLQLVRPRYGVLTDVFAALGLFSVSGSLWMRGLLGLLVVNTLVCTLNRWPRIWRIVFRPTVAASDSTFLSAAHKRELVVGSGEVEETVSAFQGVFARRGYRVLERTTSATYLYADRNRFSRLGTLATHLAIILILVGAVVTSVFGVRNGEFIVPEGSTRAVGFGTNLTVKADSFADEYYPEGPPKDYRSDLILYENGKEVARQTVRVNEPLVYNGIRFHQAFFGPAVVMQVKDATGKVIFEDGVGLAYQMNNRPLGYFELPSAGLVTYVIGPASGTQGDTLLAAGQVRIELLKGTAQASSGNAILTLGQPQVVNNLTFTFLRERQFTGLMIVRDPGASIIWVAGALMVIGMGMVFYFPHRRYWVRVRTDQGADARVSIVGVAGRDPGFTVEFDELVGELEGFGKAARGEPSAVGGPPRK
jgi:cytochrome c biogenesis protein